MISRLPRDVTSCFTVYSFYITEAETRLLNDINTNHAAHYFGKGNFTYSDLLIRLEDAIELYDFLLMCFNRVVKKQFTSDTERCGYVRIGGASVVPFVVHTLNRCLPLFYFEEVQEGLNLQSLEIDGWDYAYLKFCFKVQGIKEELFKSEECKVVKLDQIKSCFAPGTTFEDYWPMSEKQNLSTVLGNGISGSWTIKSSELNTVNSHTSSSTFTFSF